MMEREIVELVRTDTSALTDFGDDHWFGVDPLVLESCFGKGFIAYRAGKLVVTDLGRRTFGDNHERHH